jgi:uncharacterized protein YeaO (DUF488 family)
VRLGTPRAPDEGTRIGTVRRPPRGVPKEQFASGNWYDVWFPNLAPSVPTMKLAQAAVAARGAAQGEAGWDAFTRAYKAEMAEPAARHDIQLLATLSHSANFSVGCYCEDESRCHRSLLRQLLVQAGARLHARE